MDKKQRINKETQAELMSLLGKLLNNGFSLRSSIRCLSLKYPNLKYIFQKMLTGLNMGQSFSQNIRSFNLSEMMISQFKLAEQNGLLKQAILQVGELMAVKNKQAKKLKLLMIYPIFIFIFLILIILFIKAFFTFDYKTTTLSFWLEVSDWMIILTIIGGVFYLTSQIIAIKRFSEYKAILKKIRLPIFGEVYRSYYEYNLLFSLGLMIKSGMKVTDICEMKFSDNTSYAYIQRQLILHLKSGGNINQFIKQNKLIPSELDLLADSGLSHGELGAEILALAQIKYDETLNKAQKIITKIQPIVFGVITILILNTYLKILVPVYGMMEGMY